VLCLGAEDARIRDRVASLTMFGSYADAMNLLQDIGRRALLDHGRRVPWQPDPVPVSVLANTVADLLPAGEGEVISQAFSNGLTPIPPATLVTLSPVTQTVYHLLAGDQPDQIAANIAHLPPALLDRLTALSPRARLADLHAPVYLMHDRHDPFVPYTESQDFAAALDQLHHPHDYATFDLFAHVEVRAGPNPLTLLGDGAQLYRILTEILLPGA
jgi:hypothetical protein